jgi:hypothetical protein
MRKLATLAVSAVALLALAGCAGGGDSAGGGGDAAASNQSVAEACAIANEKLSAAQQDMNEAMSGSETDTTNAFDSISAGLDDALAEITNAEVKEPLSSIASDYKELVASLEEMKSAGTDTAKLTEISDKMTATNDSLQATSTKLLDLCG